jgi:hypothetical protein
LPKKTVKKKFKPGGWGLTSVILATQETEIRKIKV